MIIAVKAVRRLVGGISQWYASWEPPGRDGIGAPRLRVRGMGMRSWRLGLAVTCCCGWLICVCVCLCVCVCERC